MRQALKYETLWSMNENLKLKHELFNKVKARFEYKYLCTRDMGKFGK